MRNGRPERPHALDHPSHRVRSRQAQIDRLKVKLERLNKAATGIDDEPEGQ
jgi:hypothetical protein